MNNTDLADRPDMMERIQVQYQSLSGKRIESEQLTRMARLSYNDLMDLAIELDSVSKIYPPVGGTSKIVNDACIESLRLFDAKARLLIESKKTGLESPVVIAT